MIEKERKQHSKERITCVLQAARSLSLSERSATRWTKQRVLLSVFMDCVFRRLDLHDDGLAEFGEPPAESIGRPCTPTGGVHG